MGRTATPLVSPIIPPLRSLSEREERDEAEGPEAEDPEADELDLELWFVLLDPDGDRGLRVLGEFLAVLFSLAGAATSLGGFAS